MTSSDETKPRIGRRAVIAGGGLALGAALASPPADAAAPAPGAAANPRGPAPLPASSVESTIASPRQTGIVYRTLFFFDFSCETSGSRRIFGGSGVFADPSSYLWASVDIPAGAQVYDVEWYVENVSGSTSTALTSLWSASAGALNTLVTETAIPSGELGLTAWRSVVAEDNNGPYPTGTKLALGIPSLGRSVQVNGARVGLVGGGGEVSTLGAPVVVYDTRATGGRFAINETRTVFLSPRLCKPGSVAVTLNISAFSASAAGFLRVYPQEAALPSGRSFTFPATDAVNAQITVPVSPSRRLKIRSTQPVHIVVEVVGSVG